MVAVEPATPPVALAEGELVDEPDATGLLQAAMKTRLPITALPRASILRQPGGRLDNFSLDAKLSGSS